MKAVRKIVSILYMMGLCVGFTACSDEEEIHQSVYTSEFKLISQFHSSSSSGDLKPDMTYENQVIEGAKQICAKYKVQKPVTYTGNDYAAFDAEALALLEPAVAEMQAWQEKMHALKYEKDHKGAKFIYKYQYIVKRDSVTLKESDEITFSYSRGSLKNVRDYIEDNVFYFACNSTLEYDSESLDENYISLDLTNGVKTIGLKKVDRDELEVVFFNPSNKPVDAGTGWAINGVNADGEGENPSLKVILEADFMPQGLFEYGQWYAWVKGTHNGLPFAMMVPFDVVEPTSDFI